MTSKIKEKKTGASTARVHKRRKQEMKELSHSFELTSRNDGGRGSLIPTRGNGGTQDATCISTASRNSRPALDEVDEVGGCEGDEVRLAGFAVLFLEVEDGEGGDTRRGAGAARPTSDGVGACTSITVLHSDTTYAEEGKKVSKQRRIQ